MFLQTKRFKKSQTHHVFFIRQGSFFTVELTGVQFHFNLTQLQLAVTKKILLYVSGWALFDVNYVIFVFIVLIEVQFIYFESITQWRGNVFWTRGRGKNISFCFALKVSSVFTIETPL